jgi:hypothetical protein
MENKYKVHKFELRMTKDEDKLELFLNSLDGKIISIIPNVQPKFLPMGATASVNFLFIVEEVKAN